MTVDFPRAWEISRDPAATHHRQCSYELTAGTLLCDCWVLHGHPEYRDQAVLYSTGGKPFDGGAS